MSVAGGASLPRDHARRRVFLPAALLIGVVVLLAAAAAGPFGHLVEALHAGIVERFGWFYVLSMAVFLGFMIWLGLSRYGRIRLGPDDSRPEFSTLTWFAMLFSAGMGIGLLFFGVAEPILHFSRPAPPVAAGHPFTAARHAMGLTFFHWGLHPWAVYCLVGLSLAYFGFRRGYPLSVRSLLAPLLGDRVRGPIGDVVDVLAVVSTMFGVATSLGLGALQVNAGLDHLLGIGETSGIQIALIAGITALATWSVVSGLDVGIRRLSELNMVLAGILLLFVFLAGPTLLLLRAFVENLGIYLQHLPWNTFWTASFETRQQEWLASWTVFYWAWWIAWSPFVGMFIARISRGRTIREFVGSVLLAPTCAGFAWLTIFGNSALDQALRSDTLPTVVSESVPRALFVFLEAYPGVALTATLATICIVLFFVTSSDSASMVIDIISSGGRLDPPVATRIFWAVTEGVVAIALLLAGGLKALQTAAITTALPFTVVLWALLFSLRRALREELDDA